MDCLKMIGIGLLSAFGGYIAGVPLGLFLGDTFSENPHDPAEDEATSSHFRRAT